MPYGGTLGTWTGRPLPLERRLVNRDRQRAGAGAVLFAVCVIVGFTLFGPKDGHYSATEISRPFLVATGWSPNQWLPAPFYLVVLWGLVVGVWLFLFPAMPSDGHALIAREQGVVMVRLLRS